MRIVQKTRNKIKKSTWLILCLAALVVSCLVFGCFSPLGREASFSITIGGGSSRAIDSLLWEPDTKIADLIHTITLTDGPAPDVLKKDIKAGQTVPFSVDPGHWVITVKAYLIVEGKPVLKAESYPQPVDLKPGHNPAVTIDMHKPNGEITLVSIAVTKLPTKTHYNLGDELDKTGMVVTATYSDGSTAVVTEYDLSGYDKEKTGNHVITVTYNGKTAEFEVNVINPNLPTVATPTASPAGGEVAVNTSITLTTATEGAKIYYTQDDTVPNATSTLYSDNRKPIITANNLTLKVYAVKDEMNDSDILTVEYTLSATVNAQYPSIITNPQGAEIIRSETTELSVTVSDLTDGGELSFQWYSGNSPTNNTSGTPIQGANLISYNFITSTTTTPGNYYYYCTVTNTNTNVNGVQTATTTSAVATVMVYGTGAGINGDPFIVYNEATLERVGKGQGVWNGDWSLSAHYKQIRDIYFSSVDDCTLVGTSSSDPFTGRYDGNGKIISNLKIIDKRGLFGFISEDAIVQNVGLVDCDIKGGDYTGAVVGENNGIVQDCYVTGNVLGIQNVGGVVGYNMGTVENCYAMGDVSGSYTEIGGVVGYNSGMVKNCHYAMGEVSGTGTVGGVVGYNGGTVENCYSTGEVKGTSENVGGVVGYNSNGCTVEKCYSTGDVSGTDSRVGGVVGVNSGTQKFCYATGNVSGTDNVGGVTGYNTMSGYVENCYATGKIIGTGDGVGGVVGNSAEGAVQKCYATGNVSGTSNVGGVLGGNGMAWPTNCVALNLNISGTTDVGRITGSSTGRNNYGRKDMKVNGTVVNSNDENCNDGADITALNWGSANWWKMENNWNTESGTVWDFDEVWEWGDYNLPILQNMPGMTQDPKVKNN